MCTDNKPINLMSGPYKIIAKISTDRLKEAIPKLKTQVFDCVIVANECVE